MSARRRAGAPPGTASTFAPTVVRCDRRIGDCHRGERVDRDPCAPRRGAVGGRGGGAPRQSANVQHRVCWLTDLKEVSQPSAKPPKPPLRARSGATSTGPSRASSPASRSPVSRTAGATGDPRHLPGESGALCRPPFSPYLYPSGTRDRRSEAILAPVDYPKRLRAAPKRPLSRSRDQIRSRCLLTGPPDTRPNPP